VPYGIATFQVAALNQAINGFFALQLEDAHYLSDRVKHVCQRAIRTMKVHFFLPAQLLVPETSGIRW